MFTFVNTRTLFGARGRSTVLLPSLFVATAISSAAAQTGSIPRTSLSTVRGRIVDSVDARPITDAEIQLLGAGSSTPFVAYSDSTGAFAIRDVPRGRYVAAFFHSALEDLAVAVQPTVVSVDRDTVDLALATPSPATVLRTVCGASRASDSTALVVGRVGDAESGDALANASVEVTWLEVVIDHGLKQERRSTTTRTDAEGHFGLCGVPEGTVTVRAIHDRIEGPWLDVPIPSQDVLRLRLDLSSRNTTALWRAPADSADQQPSVSAPVARGTARLHGSVHEGSGGTVRGASVSIRGTGINALTDAQGQFTLDSLPAGSQQLEIRAIGFVPARTPVSLRAGSDAVARLTLDAVGIALDTVRIRALGSHSPEFDARRRRGNGWFMTGEQIAHDGATSLSALARRIPGLHPVLTPNGYVLRWREGCAPAIYLNGVRVAEGTKPAHNPLLASAAMMSRAGLADDVDFLIPPSSITGLEVYPTHGAPPQYSGSPCATILIWAGYGPP